MTGAQTTLEKQQLPAKPCKQIKFVQQIMARRKDALNLVGALSAECIVIPEKKPEGDAECASSGTKATFAGFS